METFLDRLKIEKTELFDKIIKLSNFIYSPKSTGLSQSNIILLNQQLKSMKDYCDILTIRIELLEK